MSIAEFHWPLRVYIEDTDAGGIVYYVNYLKFMERARTEFMRSLGFAHYLLSEEDFLFVVTDVQIRYRRPARMDDALVATAELREQRRASLRFHQRILRGDEVLTEADIQVACVQESTLKPRALPESLVAALARYKETA